MTSSARIAGGDIQLSVDRATSSAELQQLRAEVRSTFSGMSDDAIKFANAQDRYDRALKASNGRVTASVRSAELNLRKVQSEATSASKAVVRSSNESTSALRREEQQFGRLGRGALAGSGLLRGLGRSVAFASSSFLGGAGLIFAIKSATDAATEEQAAEGQLETALKNRGQAVDQLHGRINGLVAANAALGFGESDVTKALTTAVTATGSLEGATRILSVAQNVARAQGTSLADATQRLTKGFLGQRAGFKALGIDLRAGAKGWEVIDAVQGKYAGRAVAYANSEAGARAKLRAELERTKVTIGNELLPLENQLATSVADYLGKAENQAKIQHDVAVAAHDVGVVFKFVSDHTTELKTALEILLALKVASTLSGWATMLGGFASNMRVATAASQEAAAAGGIASAETAIAGTGAAAATARGQVGSLRGGLIGLGALSIAPIVIPILINVESKVKGKIGDVAGGTAATAYDDIVGFLSGGAVGNDPVSNFVAGLLGAGPKKKPKPAPKAKPTPDRGFRDAVLTQPGGTARLDRASQLDLNVSNAQTAVSRGDKGAEDQLIKAERDKVAYDRKYEAIQQDLIRRGIGDKKVHAQILQRLQSDEQGALGQIQSIEDQRAAAAKAAADKAAAAAKKRREDAARAHRAALEAHRQDLASRLGGIETRITTAQTAEAAAPNTAQLKLQQDRERKARQDLVAFFTAESHDPQLTPSGRATAKKNAAKAQQDLAKSVIDNTSQRLKVAVQIAETAVAAATEGTAAYARAIAADKKALAAEIAYDKSVSSNAKASLVAKSVSSNAKASLVAKDEAVADRLVAQKKLAALDKKTATSDGGAREQRDQFLGDVQRIISAYAPNANLAPQPSGKTDTHLFNVVHELRQQTPVLQRLVQRTGFPASGYALQSAFSVTG